jgi:hypothetical protein
MSRAKGDTPSPASSSSVGWVEHFAKPITLPRGQGLGIFIVRHIGHFIVHHKVKRTKAMGFATLNPSYGLIYLCLAMQEEKRQRVENRTIRIRSG